MLHYRNLPLILIMLLFLVSCNVHTAGSTSDLIPTLCHKEINTGMLSGTDVGILFITIENLGSVAGPSTMTISYRTNSPEKPLAHLVIKTPDVPSHAEIWVMVDLPHAPDGTHFLEPAGNITITLLQESNRTNNRLVTDCNDLR